MSARSRLALPRRGHQTGHQNPGNNLQIGAQHDDEKNAARRTPRTVRGKYGSVASVTEFAQRFKPRNMPSPSVWIGNLGLQFTHRGFPRNERMCRYDR
jgi:hypothetical protein